MTKEYKIIVCKKESVAQSWLRDASTAALCIALIGIGVLVGSGAMQWLGAIFAFLTVLAQGVALVKAETFDVDGAQVRLNEIKKELEA